jgi:hypothetical protein
VTFFSRGNHRDSAIRKDRYAEIPGKMIEGTEWYDPKRHIGSDKSACNGPYTPISAPNYQGIELANRHSLSDSLGCRAQLRARQKLHDG